MLLISIELAPIPSDRRRSTIAVTKWKARQRHSELSIPEGDVTLP